MLGYSIKWGNQGLGGVRLRSLVSAASSERVGSFDVAWPSASALLPATPPAGLRAPMFPLPILLPPPVVPGLWIIQPGNRQ